MPTLSSTLSHAVLISMVLSISLFISLCTMCVCVGGGAGGKGVVKEDDVEVRERKRGKCFKKPAKSLDGGVRVRRR